MGMCIDIKEGESVILKAGELSATVRIDKKNGRGVRIVVTAPPAVTIIPPSKQQKITPL